tara:strand:+ start:105 stop:239 length:135 start_codon:yes stop_codon:yes gene_type:complete
MDFGNPALAMVHATMTARASVAMASTAQNATNALQVTLATQVVA